MINIIIGYAVQTVPWGSDHSANVVKINQDPERRCWSCAYHYLDNYELDRIFIDGCNGNLCFQEALYCIYISKLSNNFWLSKKND